MTTFEFVLGYLMNVQGFMQFFSALAVIVFVVSMVARWAAHMEEDEDVGSVAARVAKLSAAVFVPLFLVACAPTVDDLWRVRIGLLKLEVVSPGNVEKLGDHAETIVKGLECKYLGQNCPAAPAAKTES